MALEREIVVQLERIALAFERLAPPFPEPTSPKEPSMEYYLRRILEFEEGNVTRVYASYEGGNDTAGIGHKLRSNEVAQWSRGRTVPAAQVEAWYAADAAAATMRAKEWLGDVWAALSPLRRALAIAMAFQMGTLDDWVGTLAHIEAEEWGEVRDHILVSKWATKDTPKRARRMAEMWASNRLLEEFDG